MASLKEPELELDGGFNQIVGKQTARLLAKGEAGALYKGTNKRLFRHADSESRTKGGHGGNGHGHGHGEKPPSILTAVASAIINYLLMFGLCCAYGMIMFTDDWLSMHRGLGVKLNLCTVLIMGGLLSLQSRVPVAMGGPDLNPVVFLGTFVSTIAEEIAGSLNLEYPSGDKRRLIGGPIHGDSWEDDWAISSALRRLGGGSKDTVEFCTGDHYTANDVACDDFQVQVRATVIFAVAFSSFVLAVMFFLLGFTHKTKFVAYVPTNIMEAFLSCVGFKVFKYALKFCKFEAKQFIPAAMIGVPLYFLKAKHIGNPAIVIPTMLLVPLGIFYVILFSSGGDLESARKNKWMFPKIDDVPFYALWTDSIGQADKINFSAWLATVTDFIIMMVVCCMDNLLKLSSTEAKLPVKVDKDYEIQLHGLGNILTTLCGASVGYMQLKFNVINYGVMGNSIDRRGGFLCAVLCGACFFGTIEHFNFLPRMFLSSLLFFAGSGFVAENLYGSRLFLTFDEWIQVLMVLIVFIASGSLLYAVIAGFLMIGVSFVIRYAQVPCTVGAPMRGDAVLSCERRFYATQTNVQHIANEWLLVVRLKGYVFFASATNLMGFFRDILEGEMTAGIESQRIHFIIIDCEVLDAMDSSAAKSFQRFAKDAGAKHVKVLWSGISGPHEEYLRRTKTLGDEDECFHDLDEAILFVEEQILDFRRKLQVKWRNMSFAFRVGQDLLREQMQFHPFDCVLDSMDAQFGGRFEYCSMMPVFAYRTLLWDPGESDRELFLVHSGAVALYERLPSELDSIIVPLAVYRHGWFLNRESLLKLPTRYFAVVIEDGELISWSREQWAKLDKEKPYMASRILEEAMRQSSSDLARISGHAISIEASLESKKGSGIDDQDAVVTRHLLSQRASLVSLLEDANTEREDKVKQGILPSLEAVEAALFFESYGLYQYPADEGTLPALPRHIHDELKLAFETYQTNGADGPVVPWESAMNALQYAGLFDVLLPNISRPPLNAEEFIRLGHEAAFVRFSQKQLEEVDMLYHDLDENEDGQLSFQEIVSMFAKIFAKKRLSHDDVKGIAGPWDTDKGGQLNKETFTAFISRLVRKHSVYWWLIDEVRSIWGLDRTKDLPPGKQNLSKFIPADKLFSDVALQNSGLGREELMELLWSSGCYGNGDCDFTQGLCVTIDSIVQAAHLFVGKVDGDLPPKPRQGLATMDPTAAAKYEIPVDPPDPPADPKAQKKKFKKSKFKKEADNTTKDPKERNTVTMKANSGPLVTGFKGNSNEIKDLIIDVRCIANIIYNDQKQPMRLSRGALAGKCDKGHGLCVFELPQDDTQYCCSCCQRGKITAPERMLRCAEGCQYYLCVNCCQDKASSQTQDACPLSVGSSIVLPEIKDSRPRMSNHFFDDEKEEEESKTKLLDEDEPRVPGCRPALFYILERPETHGGKAGKFVQNFMSAMVVLNLLLMVIKSLSCRPTDKCFKSNIWFNIEAAFAGLFTFEYIIRLLVSNALTNTFDPIIAFIKHPMNLIDLVSVMPFYVGVLLQSSGGQWAMILKVARLFKLVRILRALRLVKVMPPAVGRFIPPLATVFLVIWGIYMKEMK